MKEARKKWLVILRQDQYDWIKETAESTDLRGSDIVRAIIDKQMKNNVDKFKAELAQEQWKIELQKLNDKEAEIETRKKELSQKIRGEKILVS